MSSSLADARRLLRRLLKGPEALLAQEIAVTISAPLFDPRFTYPRDRNAREYTEVSGIITKWSAHFHDPTREVHPTYRVEVSTPFGVYVAVSTTCKPRWGAWARMQVFRDHPHYYAHLLAIVLTESCEDDDA